MANLFWGAFFVFVNIDLNLEYCRIGLIPEFIGYILLIKWINRIREDEKCIGTGLNTAKGWLIFLGVVSGIDYCLALLGIALQMSGMLSIILMSILIGISCYCWIKMINAVSVMESFYEADFNSGTLQRSYRLCLCMDILMILPLLVQEPILHWALTVFYFPVVINLLVQIQVSRKRYEKRKARGTE